MPTMPEENTAVMATGVSISVMVGMMERSAPRIPLDP
jgi:hypothetical protein